MKMSFKVLIFCLFISGCSKKPAEAVVYVPPPQPEDRPMTYDDLSWDEKNIIDTACITPKVSGDLIGWRSCMQAESNKATSGRRVSIYYQPDALSRQMRQSF